MLNKLQDIQQLRHGGTEDDAVRGSRASDLLLPFKALSGFEEPAVVPVKD